MAEQNQKGRKVLYAEETDAASILLTGTIVKILLILGAVGVVLGVVDRIINYRTTGFGILVGLAAAALLVFLAVRLGAAMRELGKLVEKTARLEKAVLYLCKTHDVELRGYDELPPQAIVGTETDGCESMTIRENGVHFRKPGPTVRCPFCEHEQAAGIDYCEGCGQRFFFEE